jgi:hypothetical protein
MIVREAGNISGRHFSRVGFFSECLSDSKTRDDHNVKQNSRAGNLPRRGRPVVAGDWALVAACRPGLKIIAFSSPFHAKLGYAYLRN